MNDAAILVVDDDDNNQFTLVQRLAREGYANVTTASNGQDALVLLSRSTFDLVLLDVMMPGLDGIAVLTAIKEDPLLRHVPVIMISAASDLDRVVRCIELGAEDYLPKPFNKVLLRARVRASLEKKHFRDRERANSAQIEHQRGRLSELLHAILPSPAVAELEATGGVEPRRYPGVAVLFCDISGFTAYCDQHPPETVIRHLQHLVEEFEGLTARYGMEKIKTVGDAFLATGNLLLPHPDPVMAGLSCAFDMIQAAHIGPAGWELRCGLHIGPVVAGVVGRSKFSFDLWGDTVNVAARLVTVGQSGYVHLSEPAWGQVRGRAEAEPLGMIPLRGKGAVSVFRCLRSGAPQTMPAPPIGSQETA
jgi:adenylate cyclase